MRLLILVLVRLWRHFDAIITNNEWIFRVFNPWLLIERYYIWFVLLLLFLNQFLIKILLVARLSSFIHLQLLLWFMKGLGLRVLIYANNHLIIVLNRCMRYISLWFCFTLSSSRGRQCAWLRRHKLWVGLDCSVIVYLGLLVFEEEKTAFAFTVEVLDPCIHIDGLLVEDWLPVRLGGLVVRFWFWNRRNWYK